MELRERDRVVVSVLEEDLGILKEYRDSGYCVGTVDAKITRKRIKALKRVLAFYLHEEDVY